MAPKIVIGFQRTDKTQIKGPVGHSRTGACTAKGRCFHGKKAFSKRPK